jgi:hypothetical protein
MLRFIIFSRAAEPIPRGKTVLSGQASQEDEILWRGEFLQKIRLLIAEVGAPSQGRSESRRGPAV